MREFFSSNNSTIEHIEEGNIVVTRFIGDISDESYFQIWGAKSCSFCRSGVKIDLFTINLK